MRNYTEAMQERFRVNVESGTSLKFTFTRDISYIAPILLKRVQLYARKNKRDSDNPDVNFEKPY